MTYGQDGGIDRYTVPPSHNQKKGKNKFKNKNQPELPENQTVWKSDNQGLKEESFMQTGRRGGGGVERMCGTAVAGREGGPTLVCGYIRKNDWGARQTVQPRVPILGDKASKPLTEKTCGG